jgi:hypothetical protein
MSTHSLIGLEHSDGTITAVYCHWNGFPRWNGRMLIDHYGDEERITALLALGNLSELGTELGEAHDFGTHGATHPQWCLAYERDRGDTDAMPAVYQDAAAFLIGADEADAEYVYLFREGDWYGYSGRTASWYLYRDTLAREEVNHA